MRSLSLNLVIFLLFLLTAWSNQFDTTSDLRHKAHYSLLAQDDDSGSKKDDDDGLTEPHLGILDDDGLTEPHLVILDDDGITSPHQSV